MTTTTRTPVGHAATARPPASRPGTSRSGTATAVAVLTVALLGSVVAGISLGSAVIPLPDTLRYLGAALTGGTIGAEDVTQYSIVWDVRAPRVVLAAIVGAGLSVIGVAVQAMVRNPLADPFILGVSSGASVGASAVVSFGLFAGLGVYALSTAAFLGALLASALVYAAAHTRAGLTPLRLVLTGVALAYGFQALMSVIVFFAPFGETARSVMFWMLGSLGSATWQSLPVAAGAVVVAVVTLLRSGPSLDVLAMGDESAAGLGLDTTRLRRMLFLLTAVVTGALVSVSGAVGFVGLVMPHLVRIVAGASHRRVLTIAPLAGAVFLVWVDLASRTMFAPRELPLGVITALVGVPVFVLLLRRRGYLFGGR
ncbi:FecCD family ABC transporter permease [Prauserella alba]|uniref:FecCD family ABC transporter permease n=1 Tax=Prauserella alba TaxID=176898 RepID=UPI0035564805|nr:iron complex transport system permease protein [Prauserella alba]